MNYNDVCGIGVDLEDIGRFKKVLSNKNFLKRVFTGLEIEYCRRFSSPESHFAARFAGKEAVLKALASGGCPVKKLALDEIEIFNRKDGAPFVRIKDRALNNKYTCLISLSHSKTSAAAFSVIKKKE